MTCVSNYDHVKGFIDYANKDEWETYIKNCVIPLWRNSFILKDFSENLKSEFQGIPLSSVNEENLPLLLGGIVPTREEVYKRNSLARFYSKLLGLKLSDLQSWVLGGGFSGTEAKVVVEETPFTRFVSDVFKWIDRAVCYQTLVEYEEPALAYEELKKNPQRLKERIKDFYQAVLVISVNHNYHTFFLWSLKQIPYRFIKEAYPRIDQIIDFLQNEFGLARLRWKIPFSEDSDFYKDYTIWCWAEYNTESPTGGWCRPEHSSSASFGGAICAMNETIWGHLRKGYSDLEPLLLSYFTVFPNLKEDYIAKIKDRLTTKTHSYVYYKGITAAEDRSRVGETNMTLMEMIDDVSPHLFAGSAKIAYVNDDYIQISSV